jgi:hypothetical protein
MWLPKEDRPEYDNHKVGVTGHHGHSVQMYCFQCDSYVTATMDGFVRSSLIPDGQFMIGLLRGHDNDLYKVAESVFRSIILPNCADTKRMRIVGQVMNA